MRPAKHSEQYLKDYLKYHFVELHRPASVIGKELGLSERQLRTYIDRFDYTRKSIKEQAGE